MQKEVIMVSGNVVDIVNDRIFPGIVHVSGGRIVKIEETDNAEAGYLLPGLVDAHVHVESSMLIPSRFAFVAVQNGTVATVSDPHEIANVLGVPGVNFMLKDAANVPLKIYFGVPSCVPATNMESSGAVLDANDVEVLLAKPEFLYLSEMMNYPGVVFEDKEVMAKIAAAHKLNKPIDGHAPGLAGEDLEKYAAAGITSDHEASTLEEALAKIELGIKIQIREGSAARNFAALHPLIAEHEKMLMLCSDDLHPDDMIEQGHINRLVKRALKQGYDLFSVLRIVTQNPVEHYKLDVGYLQKGQSADFIRVDNLKDLIVLETYISGKQVYNRGEVLFSLPKVEPLNVFNCAPILPGDVKVEPHNSPVKVIKAFDGDLLTKSMQVFLEAKHENLMSDIERDILKIAVLNRYNTQAKPVCGFINGIGIKRGAIATTVAHDSHNIIAVGTTDEELVKVINHIIRCKGGLVVSDGEKLHELPLPVAGLMSDQPAEDVAAAYKKLTDIAKQSGSQLHAPFMTLSFMALLVIPSLKIGDKGLFDGDKFQLTGLFVEK